MFFYDKNYEKSFYVKSWRTNQNYLEHFIFQLKYLFFQFPCSILYLANLIILILLFKIIWNIILFLIFSPNSPCLLFFLTNINRSVFFSVFFLWQKLWEIVLRKIMTHKSKWFGTFYLSIKIFVFPISMLYSLSRKFNHFNFLWCFIFVAKCTHTHTHAWKLHWISC